MNRGVMIKAMVMVLGALLLVPLAGTAQFTQQQGFQYVIKFICGEADIWDARGGDLNGDGIPDFGQFIAPGEYNTVINVFNAKNVPVRMFKKIALDGYSIPESFTGADGTAVESNLRPRFLYQVPGPIIVVNVDNDHITPPLDPGYDPDKRFFSADANGNPVFVYFELSAKESMQINCAEIRAVVNDYTRNPNGTVLRGGLDANTINQQGDFGRSYLIKGYFVLFSDTPLEVSAIYTACKDIFTGSEGTYNTPKATALDCGSAGSGGFASIDVQEIAANVVKPPTVPSTSTAGLSLKLQADSLTVEIRAQRFSAISESRLLIYNTQGELLHDSGFTPGTRLSWRPLTADGRPLANGVYFYVIQVKDVFGRVSTKIGKFALVR